jgi:uncharacterized protein DUF4136
MRIFKLAASAALAIGAFGIAGCAETLNTTVSRYQAMPAPQGQTFIVVPGNGMAANGGLEFQRYASLVAQQLAARGYTPAADAQSANLVVQFGYAVDHGQVRIVDQPYFADPFYSPFYYPRFGYRSAFRFGWNDPFWYGGGGIDSYVEYHPMVELHIRGAGNQALFDGRAQARSTTNRLDRVVPSLVEAMFTGFPGRSGETVKITIPTAPRG